ncbi:MAG: hypothetical protein IJW24_05095, partial [Clostridia bacterium]|nr:hypothetical protein [Clostridia bacterium]
SYFPATIRLESNSDGLYHEEQVELDDSFDYYLIYSKNGFYVVKTRTDGLYVATVWFGLIDDGGNLQTNICEGMQIGQLNKIKINDLEFDITDDMEWGNDLFSYEYQTWAIIEESGTYYVCVYVNDNWQIFDDKWIVSKMSKEDWLEITIDYSSI